MADRDIEATADQALPKPGDVVRAGTLIGYVGSTGNSTGPHLRTKQAVPQVQARIDLTVGGLLAQPAPEEPDDE